MNPEYFVFNLYLCENEKTQSNFVKYLSLKKAWIPSTVTAKVIKLFPTFVYFEITVLQLLFIKFGKSCQIGMRTSGTVKFVLNVVFNPLFTLKGFAC